jgi:Zn-finger nucleic acid-binding protein
MAQPTTALTCPKCAGQMQAYERNGVTIDQCDSCRGIFLDRGELERLIDAESSYYQTPAEPPRGGYPADYPPPARGGHHGGENYGGRDKRRRRGGFLGELFD